MYIHTIYQISAYYTTLLQVTISIHAQQSDNTSITNKHKDTVVTSNKNIAIVYHQRLRPHGKGRFRHRRGRKTVAGCQGGCHQGRRHHRGPVGILDAADAIIFGAPTYTSSISGPFKVFMDATSKKWFAHAWKDKIAAGFTNSGSHSGDKLAKPAAVAHPRHAARDDLGRTGGNAAAVCRA